VTGEQITAVGALRGVPARHTLDVTGLTVAPGFIDSHQHSDVSPLLAGNQAAEIALASVRQGVTTQITGNCGFSPFPARSHDDSEVRDHISGVLGVAAPSFRTLGDYRDRLESAPLPTNFAPLVGHGTIRTAVMGHAPRRATLLELDAMRRLLSEALSEGAFGLSSGLIYAPGIYADQSELTNLAALLARHRRPYVSHIRNEMDAVIPALQEALEIGRLSGAPVHISHHKVAGQRNWGRTAETLALLQNARDSGQDVTADVYPYTSGSTILRALLPPWIQDRGLLGVLERLGDSATRERLRKDFASGLPRWQNVVPHNDLWSSVLVASSPNNSEYEGLSISHIASETGRDAIAVVADVLCADLGVTTVILELMSSEDVWHVADQPFVCVGSDAISLPGKPHPRIAGTFARVISHYQRLDLPGIVHRITELPAVRFGIPRRGTIKAGNVADLVVFQPSQVIDTATYSDPLAHPDGITHVIVNGTFVISESNDTGCRPGRMLLPV
jgi:N-acyl-D-amino-acid deacylase